MRTIETAPSWKGPFLAFLALMSAELTLHVSLSLSLTILRHCFPFLGVLPAHTRLKPM